MSKLVKLFCDFDKFLVLNGKVICLKMLPESKNMVDGRMMKGEIIAWIFCSIQLLHFSLTQVLFFS
jgi:hypothetical protein